MKRLPLAVVVLGCLAAALVLASTQPSAQASPATFIVNSTADPGVGACDVVECTLREAIAAANANPGADTIEFDIPGAGPHTIQPTSALPTVTDLVTIDGTSEPNFAGTPIIELDGTNAGPGPDTDGLRITSGSTVKGLVINRFNGDGIQLSGSGGNTVAGNYIGTDVTGTADLGNAFTGVYIYLVPGNTIGGTTPGAGNVISGNDQAGIFIHSYNATGNLVQGNYIGTDKSGTIALENSGSGVEIYAAPGNTIGGTTAGAGNIISGNRYNGIHMYQSASTGNLVQGNYIGTDKSGTVALRNFGHGVYIHLEASGNTIGGATAGAGNVIAYNWGSGLKVEQGATNNTISANSIHSNSGRGIEVAFGGNADLTPPIIDATGTSVSGHSDPKCYPCTVEVFSDDEDEGRIYHGSTTTSDDATGTWTYPGAVVGPNITATITDASGNTSEFSAPVAVPSPTPTPPPAVGGIVELRAQGSGPPAREPDSGGSPYIPVAGAVAGAIALTAGAWYARRRWLG